MGRNKDRTIAVIGAGPAALAAAEIASGLGALVTLYDQMPSPARKFLMAGKSGLNITKNEAPVAFLEHYAPSDPLAPMLAAFGPRDVIAWMEGLGQPTFTGSTGRVFPQAMKASPLLRAWLGRLHDRGVTLRTRHRWTGWQGDTLMFQTPDGEKQVAPDTTILAMGGASWARLGSDGIWANHLAEHVRPFEPSNVGFRVAWSEHMHKHFGSPVKNTGLTLDGRVHRGEFIVSARGIEGGGLYPLTPSLRSGVPLTLDLKPDLSVKQVTERLQRPRGKESLSNHLRKALRLAPIQIALLQEWGQLDAPLAPQIKCLPVPLIGPRPMDEAISTAGGLRWDALGTDLMLKHRPGVFACGEMLDWDAPTGGYLLTASLATGRWAGAAAAGLLGLTPQDKR